MKQPAALNVTKHMLIGVMEIVAYVMDNVF